MDTVLLVNLPRQDAERAPAVIAGLAGICKSIDADYEVADLNLQTIRAATSEEWREFQDWLSYFSTECSKPEGNNTKSFVSTLITKNQTLSLRSKFFVIAGCISHRKPTC